MLSTISQRKTNTTWYHFYLESKKKKSNSKLESRMIGTRMSWSDRGKKRG